MCRCVLIKCTITHVRVIFVPALISLVLLEFTISYHFCTAVFSPKTREELKSAVDECLKRWSRQGDCSKSPYEPIGTWDVSHVTDMNKMFYGALEFHGDISKWDVSRVTDMAYMFWGAISFNSGISKWDVSRVTSMTGAFFSTAFNGDISKWYVSRVTEMSFMFYGATLFNSDISKWDVSSLTDMESMFQNGCCSFLKCSR